MADMKKIFHLIILRLLSTIIASFILMSLLIKRLLKGEDFFKIKSREMPPAILSDLRWGVHKYVNLRKQGIRLHYVEKGDSSKPLIVCLHGFPECWYSWRHQLEGLSDKYWVVAVDMRGYADSDKPSGTSAYAIDYMVEDIKEFILTLGKQKCTIMAHDWGAAIAWALVMKYPELFDSHISCNGPHFVAFMKVLHTSWRQMLMSWYMVFFQTPWVPELVLGTNDLEMFNQAFRGNKKYRDNYSDEDIEVYKYYFSQKGARTPPINYYRNIDFGRDDINPPKVKVPSLIIWGTGDAYLSKEMAILAAAECETSVVKFVEGATHWVQQDEPQKVNGLIREYLTSRSI